MSREKKDNHRNNISQASLTMRILAGCYLLYLVYQLVKGMPEIAGASRIVSMVGIAVFSLLSLLLLGHSIYLLKTGGYDKGKEEEDSKDKEDDSDEGGKK